jgi:hypothetical protein
MKPRNSTGVFRAFYEARRHRWGRDTKHTPLMVARYLCLFQTARVNQT